MTLLLPSDGQPEFSLEFERAKLNCSCHFHANCFRFARLGRQRAKRPAARLAGRPELAFRQQNHYDNSATLLRAHCSAGGGGGGCEEKRTELGARLGPLIMRPHGGRPAGRPAGLLARRARCMSALRASQCVIVFAAIQVPFHSSEKCCLHKSVAIGAPARAAPNLFARCLARAPLSLPLPLDAIQLSHRVLVGVLICWPPGAG